MRRNDSDYFRARAEQKLELAQRAKTAEAVAAHYQLAEAYLHKAEQAEQLAGAE
jgi:hypothetical protein